MGTAELNYSSAPAPIMSDGSLIQTSYADSNQLMAVEFDSKIIIYWWMAANFGLLMSVVGIILMPLWIPFGWIVHKKQYEHMSGALTDRSINMRMGWLFKKQQNIALDKLTDVSIHEGPILSAFGVVRMQFETAGAAPFILTGVRNANQFRDLVLRQRDSLAITPQATSTQVDSNDVLVEIRDILSKIESKLSDE